MALAAVNAATYVAVSLAAPAPDVMTAPRADSPQQADDKPDMMPASEELIAAALKAGTITYEESLRQRAYALFDDPRLRTDFQGSTNGERVLRLFLEIDRKEHTLSKELLADLAPFRARPNDPISVFNQPRQAQIGSADGTASVRLVNHAMTANQAIPPPWVSRLVRGTNVRIWIQGTEAELIPYEGMVGKVWRAFPDYFVHPIPDDTFVYPLPIPSGVPNNLYNPDSAIDIYFMPKLTVSPREPSRQFRFNGQARPWPPAQNNTSSGYVLIGTGFDPDRTLQLIAHELAHVSQMRYDTTEVDNDSQWLVESTAEWVAYKVLKSLGVLPTHDYNLLDPSMPRESRGGWPPLFNRLHIELDQINHDYSSWVFFFSGSIDLGDGVVKAIWNRAAAPGPDGIYAVDDVMPLAEHFPRFTVRNWNRDLVPRQWPYSDSAHDPTFRTNLKPKPVINVTFGGPGEEELSEPVKQLSARYYTFTFVDSIRKMTFRNLLIDNPHAHVWAIQEIGGQWKEPEDWTKETEKVLCRDIPDENVTKLVLVMSNSHTKDPLPPHPLPRIVADGVGCALVHGTAKATLHVKDDSQDVTYVSSRAHLRFKPRALPVDQAARDNVAGNAEYDLLPTSVTWTAAGTVNDCTISGQILITIPSFVNQPLDPARPAQGYLNVVGLTGGDFHSVMVSAFNPDPDVAFTKTCPGDPPQVTKYASPAHWLLQVPSQPNVYDGSTVVFKGQKSYDQGKLMDFLNLLPPGTQLPQIAIDALSRTSSAPGIRLYTWEWELKPLPAASQTGGP
jgi:hypothetical protein